MANPTDPDFSPVQLSTDHAPIWIGRDLRPDIYLQRIDDGHRADLVAEVRAASARLAARDVFRDRDLTDDDFSLSQLNTHLGALSAAVTNGPGFAVLRSLPVDELSEHESLVLIRGVAAQLGRIATQSRDGQLIRHVRAGHTLGDGRVRGHQTAERLWFHTDGADAALLLCLRAADRGGLSRVASAAAVHNAMLADAPDLVAELYQPFHFHMAGGNIPGGPPTFISPIFCVHREQFSTRFVRHTLLETQKITDVPLSSRALAAFDLLDDVADRLACDMELQPGDLQIVHNHCVLHSRTAYTDSDPRLARHLLRCWISLPVADRRPGAVERGLRGGWLTDDLQRVAASTWTPPSVPAGPAGGSA
ncbi:hypothetical protein CcI6DRAFT_03363 [Frankia sp. CcI6]|uniref:TauD/TfdA family dioxygenase n=1 Tax=unclassified Frankia TaxID=2632575 RepID=UPI0003CFF075|nr:MULTISPECIES: TauD/TfdA family dioxygenase [unclassified Frankia]ETA01240.1 hypothetical protein CcI6DRAFT_03363 [Frankia sp. CcI6]OFB42215.1 taurine catabolism dioxygenase TauD [Frankia sp. CgIM4]OHV52796.1 taurine catabolism dioxygenase TauD [Frankia sp. CgIS1]